MRSNYWLQSIGRQQDYEETIEAEAEAAQTGQPVDLHTNGVIDNYFCKSVHQRALLVTSQHTGIHSRIHKCKQYSCVQLCARWGDDALQKSRVLCRAQSFTSLVNQFYSILTCSFLEQVIFYGFKASLKMLYCHSI